MERWLVKLDGDQSDLEEFPHLFPDGDVYALAEEGRVYLTGTRFDPLEDPSQVREIAAQALDEFVGIILLLWPGLQPPSIGDVYREDDVGQRSRHMYESVHESVRAKDRATAELVGETLDSIGSTEAQQLLAASRLAHRAQVAIMLWADPHRTWPRLYRILEELELQLSATVSNAGLCTNDQKERFMRSANTAEVAGNDARHAGGQFQPPKDPMSLQEASAFVGALIQATLRRVHADANQTNAV